MFIDEAKFRIKSGKGGDGLIAFRHEKYMEKGGPSGGNGGNGGSIIFMGDKNENTLLPLRYFRLIEAPNGENGKIKNMSGAQGEDKIIKVPLGTQIFDEATGDLLADITADQVKVVIAKGGKGGRGNATFATSRNQAPKIAEPGGLGEEYNVKLELKVLADIGLVGYPSVGKSTLLSVVSQARPKIAAYHFTTLQPNLGLVECEDSRSFVMADLPGLIEGASAGLGLGFQFLKHIERTKVILHILDSSHEDLFTDYETIRNELSLYDESLKNKTEIIVLNKIDSEGSEDNIKAFIKAYKKKYKEEPITYNISAIERKGIKELLYACADALDAYTEPIKEISKIDGVKEYNFIEEEDKGFKCYRDYTLMVYRVSGPKIDEIMRGYIESSQESILRVTRAIRHLGIEEELKALGCVNGDIVRVGDVEFEFNE